LDFNFRPLLFNQDTIITVGFNNIESTNKWFFTKTDLQGDSISNDTFDFSQTHLWNVNIGVDKINQGFVMYGFGRDLDSNEVLSFVLLDEHGKLDTMYDKQFHPEYNWMIDVRDDFSGDMVFMENNYLGNTTLEERRIIRMNREGEITWNWSTGSQKTDAQPNAFEVHPNGSYLFLQHDTQSDPLQVRKNPYVFNVDTSGNIKWIKQLYPPDLFASRLQIREIAITQNGDILVVGDIFLWNDDIGNYNPYRGYIARLNQEGEILWEKNVFDRFDSGLEKESFLNDIVEMEDGSIAATGIQKRLEGEIWADMWLVKLSPDGCLNTPGCSDTLDISVPTLELQDYNIEYSIAPNPSNGIFEFIFSSKINTLDLEVVVYNQIGQIILKETINQNVELDISDHSDGIYYYSILSNFCVLDSGKLIKQE